MNRKLGKIFTVSLIVFCFGLISIGEIKAQKVNKILNRIEKRLRATKTFRAKVEMQRYNAQLQESDISIGNIVFAAGKSKSGFSARIDWNRPTNEQFWITNGEFVLYRPRLKQAIAGSFDQLKSRPQLQNPLFFFNQSAAELKKDHIALIVKEKEKTKYEIKTTHLLFVPKIVTLYKSVEMWVDKKGMPVQIKINEKNNDSITVYLTEIKRNKKIAPRVFQNKLPGGTRIIKG